MQVDLTKEEILLLLELLAHANRITGYRRGAPVKERKLQWQIGCHLERKLETAYTPLRNGR